MHDLPTDHSTSQAAAAIVCGHANARKRAAPIRVSRAAVAVAAAMSHAIAMSN
jgi:hypothetical protein